ncbi:MAG: M48 family metalloprotease [Polyangiaceae bacterium]|nr:M48 family metalloprotease [Polyangiaceae bacterium]
MTQDPGSSSSIVLTDISPAAWEHPADRAALQALRAIPGFDLAVRKILAFTGGEQGIRLIFQANSVRVGPRQFPRLFSMMAEVQATLDWQRDVEVYVSQTPMVNAMSVGFDRPFIVVKSGLLELLTEREQRVVLGHELGHIMSGHALYHTMLYLLVMLGLSQLPFLTGIALIPIRLGLMEWYRKSELSADRAGLLASQSREDALRVFLRLAGGGTAEQTSLDAFMDQAREYAQTSGPLDTVYKMLNTLDLDHPFSTMRAAELGRWIEEGHYDQILLGRYTRRGQEGQERRFTSDFSEAAQYYGREAKETVDQVVDAAQAYGREAKETVEQVLGAAQAYGREAKDAVGRAIDAAGEALKQVVRKGPERPE